MAISTELPAYMALYLEELTSKGKVATMKQYRSGLRVFTRWFKDYNEDYSSKESFVGLSIDDYQVFVHWLNKQDYTHATMNRIATTISNLQTFLRVSRPIKIRDLIDTEKTFPLEDEDFISDLEFKKLNLFLTQGSRGLNIRRHPLTNRNLSIIHLMRHYGLTPAQITSINMEDINLAQNELVIYFKTGHKHTLKLQQSVKNSIYAYLHDIKESVRPRYHSKDPLFVAYMNSTESFQYDYALDEPKRLAERSIMKMLQVAIDKVDLRQLSSTHFRNRCILDYLKSGHSEEETMNRFGITFPYYLKRFRKYIATSSEVTQTEQLKNP